MSSRLDGDGVSSRVEGEVRLSNGNVIGSAPEKDKKAKLLFYATTLSNSAVAIGLVAALSHVRAGWLTWILCGLGLTLVPRFNRVSYQFYRWPLLGIIYAVVTVELVLYCFLRLLVRSMELAVATPSHRELRRKLSCAKSYSEWLKSARNLDASKGAALWLADLRSTRYNFRFVKETIRRLRTGVEEDDWRAVVAALRLCTRPNVGGVMAPQLFSATHTGEPKTIVSDFVDEVSHSIEWLTDRAVGQDKYSSPIPHLFSSGSSEADKCIRAARDLVTNGAAAYGETALSLSGGGALGTYHFGVCRALYAEGLLPNVVSGTSAGAIVAAFLCSRTKSEIERDLFDDQVLQSHLVCFDQTPWQCLRHFLKHGVAYDRDRWMDLCRWFANDHTQGVPNMTFLEAYQRSGRSLAITVSAKGKRAPPVLLTHHTSPNVLVASAIVATAGVPGLIEATILLEKDPETGKVARQLGGEAYMDGSIVHDIPTLGLKEAFNAKFIVASQVNPHIVPMLYHTHGAAGEPSRWRGQFGEDAWRGGFLLAALELFLRSDMRAKLQYLRDIDVTPGWTGALLTQNFEGSTTIIPELDFRDYFHVFSNPDSRSMQRFLRSGRVAAYQKIAMIRTRCSVERALADGRKKLERAVLVDPAQPSKQRSRSFEMRNSTDSSGALHWTTPETISFFGAEDSDDDSAYFTDDGA